MPTIYNKPYFSDTSYGPKGGSLTFGPDGTASPQGLGPEQHDFHYQERDAMFRTYGSMMVFAMVSDRRIDSVPETEFYHTVPDDDDVHTNLHQITDQEYATSKPIITESEPLGPGAKSTLIKFDLKSKRSYYINQGQRINVKISKNEADVIAANINDIRVFADRIEDQVQDMLAQQVQVAAAVALRYRPGFWFQGDQAFPNYKRVQTHAPSNLIRIDGDDKDTDEEKKAKKYSIESPTRSLIQPHAMVDLSMLDFDYENKIGKTGLTALQKADGVYELYDLLERVIRRVSRTQYFKAYPHVETIFQLPELWNSCIRRSTHTNYVFNLAPSINPMINPYFAVTNRLEPSIVKMEKVGPNFKMVSFPGDSLLMQTRYTPPGTTTAATVAWCSIRPKKFLEVYVNAPALNLARKPVIKANMLPEAIKNMLETSFSNKSVYVEHAPGALTHVFQDGNAESHLVKFVTYVNMHIRFYDSHNEGVTLVPIKVDKGSVIPATGLQS